MRNFTELASVRSDQPAPFADQLRLAVAAYLARFLAEHWYPALWVGEIAEYLLAFLVSISAARGHRLAG